MAVKLSYTIELLIELLDYLVRFDRSEVGIEELRVYIKKKASQNIEIGKYYMPEEHEMIYFAFLEQCWIVALLACHEKISHDKVVGKIYKVKDYIKVIFDLVNHDLEITKKDFVNCKSVETTKKLVYFDNNFFIKNKELKNANKNEYQLVYSPAHLEELANSAHNNSYFQSEFINKDIEALSEITDNYLFLPDFERGVKLCIEPPYDVYRRVVYRIGDTKISELEELLFMSLRPWLKAKLKLNISGDTIKDSLSHENVVSYLNELHKDDSWYELYKKDTEKFWYKYSNDYFLSYGVIEHLSKLIDILDNNPEPVNKYRSHLHDVTHLIYALHADIFVSDDKRLCNKYMEICSFFKISPKCLSGKEFLNRLSDVR